MFTGVFGYIPVKNSKSCFNIGSYRRHKLSICTIIQSTQIYAMYIDYLLTIISKKNDQETFSVNGQEISLNGIRPWFSVLLYLVYLLILCSAPASKQKLHLFLHLHKLTCLGFLPKQVLQCINPMEYHPPLGTCNMIWNGTFPVVWELVAMVPAGKKWCWSPHILKRAASS